MRVFAIVAALIFLVAGAHAEAIRQTKGTFEDKFRQLDEDWPTPTETRLASGAPGPAYWQQDVDYVIKVSLDETAKRLTGTETITYTNKSPHTLTYLWLQLDQNRFRADSLDNLSRTDTDGGRIAYYAVRRAEAMKGFKGGYDISNVRDKSGAALDFDIVDTNMRIDLAKPLKPGETTVLSLAFAYNMIDTNVIGGRAGYECFVKPDEDGNCIFLAAQFFPRLHAYSDYEGWHNKAFLGSGEFTLEFGDYRVELTVPDDHVVSSTGVLQNPAAVLSSAQQTRLATAQKSDTPVYIVTADEARANETTPATGTATWVFSAQNVRDFAWASSRKFIWDGMRVKQDKLSGGADVLAMSFYPKEAEPLWSAYSTKSIAHTMRVYSRFSFPYPYPTAQSVNGPVGGMEYPMITFNGPRPDKDKDGNLTYSARTKYGLIGVVIHEVGHIYFPMTVNSDERQWTWMDEGINTFLQFVAEQEWEENFPSRRGEPKNIIPYMISTDQVPIMTQSDSVLQFGNNGYGKPATALNILRETVLGRDAFDRAFLEYAQRWKFKRPTPYDFFRTMEEASGTDLDWFWRGWFYSTEHVDISIDDVTRGNLQTKDPDAEAQASRAKKADEPQSLTAERNQDIVTAVENDPSLLDFYNRNDEFSVGESDRKAAKSKVDALEPWERAALQSKSLFSYVTFSNKGGVVMPVILTVTYKSGKTEILRLPAEIWRRAPGKVTKMLVVDEDIVSIELDPRWETADADRSNNYFPPRIEPSRLEIYKTEREKNMMERLDLKVEPTGLATIANAKPEADKK
jgi:Peptidase family M1 domain